MSKLSEEKILMILTRVGYVLGVPVEASDIQVNIVKREISLGDGLNELERSAEFAGIFLRETRIRFVSEIIGFLREGYPLIVVRSDDSVTVLESVHGRGVLASECNDRLSLKTYSKRQLSYMLESDPAPNFLVCKRELDCAALSGALDHHGHHHDSPSPLRRFLELLTLDKGDIWTLSLFALVAGILALATPLAVESLVNVVSWGIYLQPLVVLGIMLFVCLGLAGALKVLQTIVVEIIQRRQFVRIVGDLSHRFPRANQNALRSEYPRELANRFFDIMTIQKATAVLLMDGVTIVLTTVLGLVLLAFYHPFLLGFDIILLACMFLITWLLGRGGIRTAIDESITKYRVAHWLQDVASSPGVFKTEGGERLAVLKANQLTSDYIYARQKQFRVVIRQVIFAISLQVVASTVLLALGGWLVIDGQLTLGQLVASELVVTVVVGAFAKAGKSLEKFYDLMAGMDKVGHMLDVPVDSREEVSKLDDGPASVSWSDLNFSDTAYISDIPATSIEPGSLAGIVGDDVDGRSFLLKCLAGLVDPNTGNVQIGGFDAKDLALSKANAMVCYAGKNDLFHGSLRENVDLGRSGIGVQRVRESLAAVGLDVVLQNLPEGLQTILQTEGYPLTELQARKVVIARALVSKPKLLIIDRLIDDFSQEDLDRLWNTLTAPERPWTILVNTNRDDIAKRCNFSVQIRKR